jgi:hypothetical protein
MKPDKNKDITKHIAEMLKEHSLPYQEGAWERFKDFEAAKKKRFVVWPYFISAVAAMLLLALSLFLIIGKDEYTDLQGVSQEVAKSIIDTLNQSTDSEDLVATLSPKNLNAERNTSQTEPIVPKVLSESNSSQVAHMDLERVEKSSTLSYNNDTIEYKETQQVAFAEPTTSNKSTDLKETVSSPSYTFSEPLNRTDVDLSSVKKWDFSVELSPNIRNSDVNFGGGVAIAYNLNDKISIGSGLSYMQLDAERSPNSIDIPSEFLSLDGSKDNKSLNNISTSLVGLDIPINLKLNIGNSMYANAGVSLFSVLNESRYNNFEERIAVTALASPTLTSTNQTERSGVEAQTLYSQEISTSNPYEGKNFTGFLNFSMGYKLPFLPKMNLAIEPYFKIPIGSLSNQDMDLNNGGFKIKASF